VSVGWDGERVVLTTSAGAPAGIVLYDPSADEWQVGAEPPCDPQGDGYEQIAWLGDALVAP
jgi:hypothetical protein